MKNLFSNSILGSYLIKSDYLLNWQGTFINFKDFLLSRLKEKVEYPTNEDIEIFNLIKNHHHYQYQHIRNIYTDLVHPLYPQEYVAPLKIITYNDIFYRVNYYYS